MRNARRVVGILGALAGGALSCGGVLVGCGSDDSGGVAATDGGSDSTTDGGRDAPSVGPDARPDVAPDAGADSTVVVPDARPDTAADSGLDATLDARADVAVAIDATQDVALDARPDVTGDARAEAAADAGADAPSDASPDVADVGPDRSEELAFPVLVATALCNQVALCCADGGMSQFDMNNCVTQFTGSGYQYSSFGESAIANGHILYSPEAGAACLGAINSIAGCAVDAGLQPQLLTNCFAALTGTLAAGASCQASLECAPGNYCAPTDGGVSGICAPIHAVGQPCKDFGDPSQQNKSSEICSYRASGNTGATCQTIDSVGNFTDAGSWTCQPQYGLGAICNIDTDCVPPMLCDLGTSTCVPDQRQLVFPGSTCPQFILDAGGGG